MKDIQIKLLFFPYLQIKKKKLWNNLNFNHTIAKGGLALDKRVEGGRDGWMIANYISGNTIYDWSWDVTTPGLRVDYNIQECVYGDYFISKSDKCTQWSKKNKTVMTLKCRQIISSISNCCCSVKHSVSALMEFLQLGVHFLHFYIWHDDIVISIFLTHKCEN